MKLNDLAGVVFNDEGWQDDWPTKPDSLWWFFGYPFGKKHCKQPELCLVEVWLTANKSFSYVRGGSFLYKADGAIGKWKQVDIPALPNLESTSQSAERE